MRIQTVPSALLLSLLACAGNTASAGGATASSAAAPRGAGGLPTKLVLIGINDTHGAILAQPPPRWLAKTTRSDFGGADWFSSYVDAIRAEAKANGGATVLLDAGDMFQGTLVSNQFQGRSVVDVYNAIGVDAAAIGNHEFDFGIKALEDREAQAKFPVLAANIFKKGTRERPTWARPTVMLTIDGLKVGVIGLTTVETPIVTQSTNIADVEFLPGGPIAAHLADELRAQGAQVVLITAHMGPKGDGEIQKVALACKGKVDAIVSGHHHISIGPPPMIVENIPIVQSGAKLQAFSVVELFLDGSGHVKSYAVNEHSLPRAEGPMPILHELNGQPVQYLGRTIKPNPRIQAILASYDGQVQKLRDSTVGSSQVELRKGGKDDLLANLAADALRSGAGGSLKAQFAFQNSGGLRVSEIAAGPITFGELFDLYPFDNQQMVLTLPAAGVRNALEAVLHAGKGPLKVSGLRYTVDWDRFHAGSDTRDAPPGAIVTELIDENTGKSLCETKSCTETACQADCAPGDFTVSVTDFLANGGDGLALLRTARRETGSVLARDIIVAYVKAHSPLTPKLLGEVSAGGALRIKQVGSPSGQDE